MTLRGSIDQIWLAYLQTWVTSKVTVTALGVTLSVDSTCNVLLQSLLDPLCQAITSGKSQTSIIAAVSGSMAFVIILMTVIIVALIVAIAIGMRMRRTLKVT